MEPVQNQKNKKQIKKNAVIYYTASFSLGMNGTLGAGIKGAIFFTVTPYFRLYIRQRTNMYVYTM